MPDPLQLSLAEIGREIKRGAISPVELTRRALSRAEQLNPLLNMFITIAGDRALQEAKSAEAEIRQGSYRGPLHGVPIVVKDNTDTAGIRTTCGSKRLAGYIPDRDATVVARLRSAGALVLGKTNLDEYALGGTTTNPHYGACRNPWNTEHVAGGSSGGSAVAVATRSAFAALGTDSGGSIRTPSSFCGVVGLKPTFGLVSRQGTFPLSWSLDHVGPIARTVEDTAMCLEAIAGYDPLDRASTTSPGASYTGAIGKDPARLRIGVIRELGKETIAEDVKKCFEDAARLLGKSGVEFEEVSVPHWELSVAAYVTISRVDAAAVHQQALMTNLGQYGGRLGAMLLAGLLVPASYYYRAQQVRTLLQREIAATLSQVDVLATPTNAVAAPSLDAKMMGISPEVARLIPRFTNPFNLTGNPSITVPCGFTTDNLPVGLQLVGRPFCEENLFTLGHALEEATGIKTRVPAIVAA